MFTLYAQEIPYSIPNWSQSISSLDVALIIFGHLISEI